MNPCYRLYRVGDVKVSANRIGVPLDHIPTRATVKSRYMKPHRDRLGVSYIEICTYKTRKCLGEA